MEIAIPLIALGGMYVISNQPTEKSKTKSKKTVQFLKDVKENYTTIDSRNKKGYFLKTNNIYQNLLEDTIQ